MAVDPRSRPRDPLPRPARAPRLPCRLLVAFVVASVGVHSLAPGVARAQPAPAADAARKPEEIAKECADVSKALGTVMPNMDVLLEPARKVQLDPKALPLLQKMIDLLAELAVARPEAKRQAVGAQLETWFLMAQMGDKRAADEIAKYSASGDPLEAADAKGWALLLRWVKARPNAEDQEKLIDELRALAKSQPDNAMTAQPASLMAESAARPALADMVERVVAEELRSPQARDLVQSLVNKRKRRAIDGKPLVIEGVTVDGRNFSTAGWKGKVVLVDVWATWCEPCVAELPEMKRAYAELHGKGLEIVGISCDRAAADLKTFLDKDRDVTWTQLFSPAKPGFSPDKPGWHPLADKFGVEGLPTMLLIDRKGVVRAVLPGGEGYREGVLKLLAEKE